jgi:hypothetical protein
MIQDGFRRSPAHGQPTTGAGGAAMKADLPIFLLRLMK